MTSKNVWGLEEGRITYLDVGVLVDELEALLHAPQAALAHIGRVSTFHE
jgi:hypothetical protein